MYVVGIDLSGPSNSADTAMVNFLVDDHRLVIRETVLGAGDQAIIGKLTDLASEDEEVVVGLDSPLSYNVGGGDRPGDARLRSAIVEVGLRSGAVMPPTMNRMVYLTLRGVSVARLVKSIKLRTPGIVEVHPGATMALRGAPVEQVIAFKKDERARRELLEWLEHQGLEGAATANTPSDHYVAACAGALAAWKWSRNELVWVERADPPIHPFDFAC